MPCMARSRHQRQINLHSIARRAMRKYGFESSFPPSVMAAADNLDVHTPERMAKSTSVADLRGLLWSSIDNFDTEDLDQIEWCERRPNGEILIRVAVADVDVYVPKGSILDMHARKNTTSVYTGIEIFPMIPDRLSKHLSSLQPNQDRLAMVVEFTVLPRGNVRPGSIYRALVRNKAQLVYEEVGAWLEGKGKIPKLVAETPYLKEQMLLQDEAALRLGKYRAEQGALELETLEARAVIKHEQVLGLVVVEDNRAKRIIENFMIGANGVMSGYLERAGIPTIHRVVRIPKYWEDIVEVAAERGTSLPNSPNALALSKFLLKEKRADAERFPDLSLTIVKLLGPGEYVLFEGKNPVGHFCLAVTKYTHSTAPNRRYVDLIIQRLVKAALNKARSPYRREEIARAAEWCTEREQASKKVERFMVKAEAATLLQGRIGHLFDAIVTGASEKGTYARLLDPPVEGRIMGRARGIHVGQKLQVRLINLDPEQGFVDFELAR